MDNSLLRKGCEVAGMRVHEDKPTGSWYVQALHTVVLWAHVPEHREWIESRCASLLVAKVREGDTTIRQYFYDELEAILAAISLSLDMETATDEQRIRAAISVLSSHHHAGNPMSRDGGPCPA